MFIKKRNTSQTRSQIFYPERQDCFVEQRMGRKLNGKHLVSNLRIDHNGCNQEQKAALARGRKQLSHMKQATTLDKDSPLKFSKRMVSPTKTPDGSVINRAAGHNDVGSIIKAQFNVDLREKSAKSAFISQPERPGKKMLRSTQKLSSTKQKHNEGSGLDFSRKVPEIESQQRDRSRSQRPAETELS
mmetsp:Transcript_31742/g.42050  ORF Transcript_31742/g.42050 Transcript_31742/m.42050 type:complete len:187 (+) Transcript_31742:339-899(+)